MQIISALAWPVVVLVAIGAVLIIAWWLREPIAQALTERPAKLALRIGKVLDATAETRKRDKVVKIEHGRLIENKPLEEEVPKRVDAQLFVLRDAHGNERAKLGVTDTDAAALQLYDAKGKERISLFVLADGT